MLLPRSRRNFLFAALTLLVLVLAGCASNSAKRSILAMEVRATSQANPDSTGRPSPVIVYVLSLRSIDRFHTVEINEVLDGPANVLAADLVSFRQLTVLPGEVKVAELDMTDDTRFVAVVGGIQNFQQLRWKDSVEISNGKISTLFRGNKAVIDIDHTGIRIVRER